MQANGGGFAGQTNRRHVGAPHFLFLSFSFFLFRTPDTPRFADEARNSDVDKTGRSPPCRKPHLVQPGG